MSLRPSYEFALAAAARVSCCGALASLACHPATSGTPPAEIETGEPAPAVVAEPDPYSGNTELDPSTRVAPISAQRLTLENCQTQVSAAIEHGGLGAGDESCCRTLASNVMGGSTDESVDPTTAQERSTRDSEHWWSITGECCALIQYSEAACTPWGPPTPPSRLAQPAPVRSSPPIWLDLRSLAQAKRPASIAEDTLDDRLRAAAIATWRARMVNEYGSAPVFEGLFAQLERMVELGLLDAAEIDRARSFAGQERRHGILCGAVVEALGGAAEAPALAEREFPQHGDGKGELEACLRNLLSICCLSETVAVALIAAERFEMPAGPLRELLTGIWSDECGHANFGWRLLPELLGEADVETRAGLAEYLRLAFAELETHELAHLPASFVMPPGGAAYGLCTGADARALFYATVEQVIVPGLEARGLPARRAWESRRAEPLAHSA